MAEQKKRSEIENDPTLIGNSQPRGNEREGVEREDVRNQSDPAHGDASRGRDIDPDSPTADVDRDDLGNV